MCYYQLMTLESVGISLNPCYLHCSLDLVWCSVPISLVVHDICSLLEWSVDTFNILCCYIIKCTNEIYAMNMFCIFLSYVSQVRFPTMHHFTKCNIIDHLGLLYIFIEKIHYRLSNKNNFNHTRKYHFCYHSIKYICYSHENRNYPLSVFYCSQYA